MDFKKLSVIIIVLGLAVFCFGAGIYYENKPDRVDIGFGTLDFRDAFNPQRMESRKKGKRLMLVGAAGALVGAGLYASAKKR